MTTLILILIYIALLWKIWIDYKYIKSLEELAGRLETELAHERTSRAHERVKEIEGRYFKGE